MHITVASNRLGHPDSVCGGTYNVQRFDIQDVPRRQAHMTAAIGLHILWGNGPCPCWPCFHLGQSGVGITLRACMPTCRTFDTGAKPRVIPAEALSTANTPDQHLLSCMLACRLCWQAHTRLHHFHSPLTLSCACTCLLCRLRANLGHANRSVCKHILAPSI